MVSVAPDSFARFDFRSQIIDNCEFFVSKYDVVQVITTKVATGSFVAYAVRSNEKSRDALLCSDRCEAVQDAIESLHNKSCEAVQNYITTNGFSYPPDLKKTKVDSDDEGDDDKAEAVDEEDDDDVDAASVVSGRSASSTVALSYWGSSDDEAVAMTPASSANPHVSHEKGQRRSSFPKGCHSYASNSGNNNNGKSAINAVNYTGKRRPKPPHVDLGGSKPPREPPSSGFGPEHAGAADARTPPFTPHGVKIIKVLHPASRSQARNSASDPRPPPSLDTSPALSNKTTAGNSPAPGNASSNGNGIGMGMGMGMGNTTSYRPPPPPPRWSGPPMSAMPPPMRGPAHVQSSPPQPAPQYYAPAHAQPSPASLAQGGQPVSGPPLPPPAVAPPGPGPMRAASLQYKASMPHLSHGQPGPPPGPPPASSNANAANRLYDVRLTIRWPGRGEAKILESTRPSVRALQEMAVSYARSHPAAFDNGTGAFGHTARASPDMNAPVPGSNMPSSCWALRACVRRAFFGPGEVYDMSTYRGDDLTKLFNVLSAGNIPRFEVEVEFPMPNPVPH